MGSDFKGISWHVMALTDWTACAVDMSFIVVDSDCVAVSVMQATLTMPGIAGLILTVCMSVDANGLIFERIREELREGRSAVSAIDNGFRMAFATITDSNLTHIFAAIILFSLGSGAIKGFAVTTIIGTAASFFTALSVVRLMIIYWMGKRKLTQLPV